MVAHCGIPTDSVDLLILVNTETNDPVLSDRDLELNSHSSFFLALAKNESQG